MRGHRSRNGSKTAVLPESTPPYEAREAGTLCSLCSPQVAQQVWAVSLPSSSLGLACFQATQLAGLSLG